jgi:hypothetical protein
MAEPKKIRAKVVCHQYGVHFRGDTVEVEEREYKRVGALVLLSKEDEDALRKDLDAKRAAQASRVQEDRSAANGWADKEAEGLRMVRARQLEEQKRQRELLAGGTTGSG